MKRHDLRSPGPLASLMSNSFVSKNQRNHLSQPEESVRLWAIQAAQRPLAGQRQA